MLTHHAFALHVWHSSRRGAFAADTSEAKDMSDDKYDLAFPRRETPGLRISLSL
jgi:hypothetical protein